jgi:uncharacterized membrane protein
LQGRRAEAARRMRESTTVEPKHKSLARALSWRVMAWALTVGIVYLFTGQAALAVAVAVADSLLKIFAYYLHERGWMSLARANERSVAFALAPADDARG